MKTNRYLHAGLALLALLAINQPLTSLHAQGTAFTYQGRLNDGASAAQGTYDLRFTIYTQPTGITTKVAGPLTNAAVAVSNGLFTVSLDFGAGVFDGSTRWLEVEVRTNGFTTFTTLTPRQQLTPSPYAINAASANSVAAANINGTLGLGQLPGAAVTNTEIGVTLGGTFSGNGASLNSLNASQLATGTVPEARLSTNVALLNSNQTFTAQYTFSGRLIAGSSLNQLGGNGANLMALNASQLASGSVPDARLSANVPLLNNSQTFSASNTFNGVVAAANANNSFVGTFTGNGAGLTNLNVQGANPNAALLNTNQAFTGSNTFSGVLIATNATNQVVGAFTGSGASLTSLNASQLTSGTVPDGRLSANVALLNASQTFTAANAFNGAVAATNANNSFVGAFTGNGAGLTNLNVAGASPYTALVNTNQVFTGSNTFAGVLIATNPTNQVVGAFAGEGSSLSNLSAAMLIGTVPEARLSTNVALLNSNQTFTAQYTFSGRLIASSSLNQLGGNGANLMALNASQLASGTVPMARLSPSVAILTNNQSFTASNSFSGVLIATNTNNVVYGTFVGSGAGLTNLAASTLFVDAVATSNLQDSAVTAVKIASGQVVKSLDGLTDAVTISAGTGVTLATNGSDLQISATGAGGWSLTGNAATDPTANFLGTVDAQPLVLRVENQQGFRLEPSSSGSYEVNVVGGSGHNMVASGVSGATIGGGGSYSRWYDIFSHQWITVDGHNSVGGNYGTIGGGWSNSVAADYATVPGGAFNQANGQYGFAAGYRAKSLHAGTFVWGDNSDATYFSSTSSNQFLIRASGGVGIGTASPSAPLEVAGTAKASTFQGKGIPLWQSVSGTSVQADPNSGYVLQNDLAQTTVTLPVSPAVGDVVRLTCPGDYGWKVAQNSGQYILVRHLNALSAGTTWTARDSSRNWNCVASSFTGQKLVAGVGGGQLYTSSDYGATWTARESSRNWRAVASSADGTRLLAGDGGGYLYVSTDSGVTWAAHGPSKTYVGVASSADGMKLAAATDNSQLYTSTDGGTTWVARDSNRQWIDITSSDDGKKLVAIVYSGYIYTSVDSGTNWTARMTDTLRFWYGIASSADGTKLAAVRYDGDIYTSTDSGTNWTIRSFSATGNWERIASSADGTVLLASKHGGFLWLSTDSGVHWVAQGSTGNWTGVACSADGTRFVAGVYGGQLYTSAPTATGAAWTTTGVGGSLSGPFGSAIELQHVGGGMFLPISYVGSNFVVY